MPTHPPLKEAVISTLKSDGFIKDDAIQVAEDLFNIVVEAIGDKLDSPITVTALLEIHLDILDKALSSFPKSAIGAQRSEYRRYLGEVTTKARRKLTETRSYSDFDNERALFRIYFRFAETYRLYEEGGRALTHRQALLIEYGAYVRPAVVYWAFR